MWLIAIFAILCSSLPARSIDRTIARINNDIITESDLAEVIADGTGGHKPDASLAMELATSETVASLFDRELLLQEARRLKISPEQDELHRQVESSVKNIRGNFSSEKEFYQALTNEHLSLDQLKDQLLDKTKTDFMVYHVISTRFSVSDYELDQYKQQQKAAGETLSSYRLRRLGIEITKKVSSEEAGKRTREIVTDIITSGISFEEGVRKYSQVPGAAEDGGDMGYLSADKLSEDVRKAVENLETGQASAPIIAGGYANIFYMESKRGARSSLNEEKFFEARKELLADLRRKAILQIFDDRLLTIMPDIYKPVIDGTGHVKTQQTPAPAPIQNQQLAVGGQTAGASPTPSPRYIPASATPAVTPANYYQATPTPTPSPAPRGIRKWFKGGRQ